MQVFMFYFLSAGLITTAFLTIMLKNPMHSVVSMITSFIFMAGIYLTLSMQFLAVIQIMVYAGAIMVLFLFVIMLFDLRKQEYSRDKFSPLFDFTSIFVVLFGGFLILKTVFSSKAITRYNSLPEVDKNFANVDSIAHSIFGWDSMIGQHNLIFEVISVLLLAAIISAVVMAKRKI